jgi:DnaJ homolog subfamily C member 28
MDDRLDAIEEIIRRAQAEGAFDNLPGQGDPLDLNKNPFAADSQLAHDLIQNNGFTLPWIADKQEIMGELVDWRSKLTRAWQRQDSGPIWERHWRESVAAFAVAAVKLNKRIADYNLKAPADSQHLLAIDVEAELRRARQSAPLPEADSPAPIKKSVETDAPPGFRQRMLEFARRKRR